MKTFVTLILYHLRLTLFFLIFEGFLISYVRASDLPPCPPDGPYHNCYGTYIWVSGHKKGDKYIGEFRNNKIHGQGIYNFASGNKYVGEYKNSKKHWKGTFTFFVTGNKYVGEYKNGKRHGKGTFTFATGDKYVGKFKNGKFNGQGTFTYKSGAKYIGKFKNEKYHGQGTYNYKSGAKDVGEFQNGKLNGFAIRYDKYGTILKQGIWKDDNFLYSQNKSTSSNSNSKLDKYKSFCGEIGFTPATEKFADCVLEAMKKG